MVHGDGGIRLPNRAASSFKPMDNSKSRPVELSLLLGNEGVSENKGYRILGFL